MDWHIDGKGKIRFPKRAGGKFSGKGKKASASGKTEKAPGFDKAEAKIQKKRPQGDFGCSK